MKNNEQQPDNNYQASNSYQPNNNYQSNNGYQPNNNYQPNNGYQPNYNYQSNNGYQPNNNYQPNNGYQLYDNSVAQQQHAEIFGILSIVFGVISLLIMCCFNIVGAVPAVLGIVFALLAKQPNNKLTSNAILGLCLSIAYFVLMVVGFIAITVFCISAPSIFKY